MDADERLRADVTRALTSVLTKNQQTRTQIFKGTDVPKSVQDGVLKRLMNAGSLRCEGLGNSMVYSAVSQSMFGLFLKEDAQVAKIIWPPPIPKNQLQLTEASGEDLGEEEEEDSSENEPDKGDINLLVMLVTITKAQAEAIVHIRETVDRLEAEIKQLKEVWK